MRRMHLNVRTRPHALLTDISAISHKWDKNLRNAFSYEDVIKSVVSYSVKVLALEQTRTSILDVDFGLGRVLGILVFRLEPR